MRSHGRHRESTFCVVTVALYAIAGCTTEGKHSPITATSSSFTDSTTTIDTASGYPCDWVSDTEVSDIVGRTIFGHVNQWPAARMFSCTYASDGGELVLSFRKEFADGESVSNYIRTAIDTTQATFTPADIGEGAWCADDLYDSLYSYLLVDLGGSALTILGRESVADCEHLTKIAKLAFQRKGP